MIEKKKRNHSPRLSDLSAMFASKGTLVHKLVQGRKADMHYLTWYDTEGLISDRRQSTRFVQVTIFTRDGFEPTYEVVFGMHSLGTESPKNTRDSVNTTVLEVAKKALERVVTGDWISKNPYHAMNLAREEVTKGVQHSDREATRTPGSRG